MRSEPPSPAGLGWCPGSLACGLGAVMSLGLQWGHPTLHHAGWPTGLLQRDRTVWTAGVCTRGDLKPLPQKSLELPKNCPEVPGKHE